MELSCGSGYTSVYSRLSLVGRDNDVVEVAVKRELTHAFLTLRSSMLY